MYLLMTTRHGWEPQAYSTLEQAMAAASTLSSWAAYRELNIEVVYLPRIQHASADVELQLMAIVNEDV